jgi:hypothetical protein
MESLTVLLTEQGLIEYEQDLRAKGISEPQHLLRLTPSVIETLIPDKPIHQRKLAALSRGRNLNASTFSMEIKQPSRPPPNIAGAQGGPFRSKSADDVLPEKPGLRNSAVGLPDLAPELQEAVNIKFGDEFNQMVTKHLKLQGVVTSPDLKYANMIVLTEQVKEAGAKPIQIGKLKDWCATQAQVMPAVVEKKPAEEPAAAPVEEEASSKKKKPPPKRPMRSNSTNDVIESDVEDPMQKTLNQKFGAYCDPMQSFLMTQGVMEEDDLMIRDVLKMMTTAQNVGVKPVQLAKLKEWMTELKELADGPVTRVPLPHERRGSKLRVSKSAISQTGKDYDNAVRASRASKDLEGSEPGTSSRRSSRSSKSSISTNGGGGGGGGEIMITGAVRRNSKLAQQGASAAEALSL